VRRVQHLAVLVCTLASSAFVHAQQQPSCVKTAVMRIYSSAFAHEETGDVLGYELAIKENNDSTADVLLYVYEGAADDEGIPLSGRISGKELTVQGNWVEHLVEYPSKKEIIQTHSVKIDGTLEAASFRGHIKIENMELPDSVQLKRVKRLWSCKR
jgi:hypothetical protein